VLVVLLAVQVGSPVVAARASTPNPPRGYQEGTPWTGSLGVSESVAQIMASQRAQDRASIEEVRKAPPALVPAGREFLPHRPGARDDLAQWPPLPAGPVAPLSAQPFAPQPLGTSFTGATLSESGFVPPDSMGVAGPTQYVVLVNGRIVTFNKATGVTDGVINSTTNAFFNSVRSGSDTTDPRIRYDRLSGRWFLTMINVSTPNRILIAVSSTSTITPITVFTYFFIATDSIPPAISSTCFADYPTLGIDASALYVGTNNFCGPTLTFDSTDGYVIRKSSVLGGGPIVATVFRGLVPNVVSEGPFTPQGVDNNDPAAGEGYFIGVSFLFFSELVLRRVSDPGGTPSISGNILIPTPLDTTFPIAVRHQGNTGGIAGLLDALDDRLFMAVVRSGRLWTAQNIAVNNAGTTLGILTRDAARWYEVGGVISPGTPTVLQSGTVFTATATNTFDERNYWIPSVMVSGQGHAALGFSTAGTNEFANAATVGRLASDPLGTMQTPVLYTSSTTAYNPPGDPGGPGGRRWGDYSYTSLDPIDDMTMWTIQEFCDATNSWGVRVVKLIGPPPATPSSASPATVPTGQSSIDVTITGAQVSGSGFFDPGPDLGGGAVPFNHIGGTVSGGVIVNSVTYTSPTSVTLHISTVGAAPGAKDVTIVNPDGQSTTGAGILSVETPPPPTITSFSPTSGPVGTSVTITGTNFTGATSVKFFDNVSAAFTVDSSTQITATVPLGATTGPISVTTPGGTATSSTDFTVTIPPPPTITSFSPTSGPVGTSVTITGTNFSGATSVKFFDNVSATFTVDSSTQITATVPLGATTGPISVTTPSGTATSSTDFTVTIPPPPTITSFSPTSGPVGTSVTITGTNFTGTTAVNFGGVASTNFTVNSSTQIKATVPAGAVTGAITVVTPSGTAVSSANFTVLPSSHDRSLSLMLRKHLMARGTLTVGDGFAACYQRVPVKIQRKVAGDWRTIASTLTGSTGLFREPIPDRAGTYRAVASKVVLANDICRRAASPAVVNG